MNESEWQKRVTETCNLLSLLWHHETDSRKSKAGFPDLCIVGPKGLLFLELKAPKGKVSPQQQAWIDHLAAAGAHAYVARPADWDRVLSDLKRISGR